METEMYTVRDAYTKEIIKHEIIDWNEVECLLASNTNYEYLTQTYDVGEER
ncbi:hypothetical protein D3C74_218880 [compost metagenome]